MTFCPASSTARCTMALYRTLKSRNPPPSCCMPSSKRAGATCAPAAVPATPAHCSRSSSPDIATSVAQGGALSLIEALVADRQQQQHASPELIESIADAIAAISCYPDLRQVLIIECGVLSFLAPLCVDDVGVQQQEAALGAAAALCGCVATHTHAMQAHWRCCAQAPVRLSAP